jgi:hypothetical protein
MASTSQEDLCRRLCAAELETLKQIILNNNHDGCWKLQAVYEELSKDGSFDEAAKNCSDSIGIYDIGYASRGDFRSEMAQAVENLNVGEHSREIVIDDAIYIFFMAAENLQSSLALKNLTKASKIGF